ncbi:MAG: hypothetical protein AB7N29_14615 [Vicinamibacterales bacterium]
MWKHCCAFVCALGGLLLSTSALLATADDPSTLPLVQFADLLYAGAFRLPDQFVNGDGFTIGGRPVAYNPARNSLFIGSRNGRLAEVSIPTPVNSANVNALPFASFLQGFYDPTEGNMWQIAGDGASIDGILVHGDRLYGSASIYYDANNTQRVSHYSRSTTLSASSFVGMASVWQSDMTGFVSGYMANVPAEWQSRLGAPAITGQCCLPIAWRTSWGPSAFGWNPSQLVSTAQVPATPLLYYPHDHHTLGHWDASGPAYGGTTQINGVAIIAGTRTALFFGRNGTGPFCYGNGTANQSLVGTLGPDNEVYCYDPSTPAKGQHAYPYQYQIWAYDLNDLAAVKAGTKQPWDVVPYGVWPFALPTPEPMVRIGGIGYDSSRQIIYVSQLLADQDGYGYRPLIHALKIGNTTGAPMPSPDPTPAPAPAPSVRVSTVAISANQSAPQPPGSTVTFSAAPSGGTAPLQYKWWIYDGAWKPVGGWTSSSTFAWTPATTYPSGRITVWVKSAGNAADEAEASTAMDFVISGTPVSTAPPSSSTRVTAVTIAANKTAPQAPGTTVTFSAVPAGGASHQFKWWIYDGSWKPVGGWTSSSTFAWTPTTTYPAGRVTVWAKSGANSADEAEASTAMDFVITGTPVTATPPPSAPPPASSRVSTVAISANKTAPQAPGTTVTFSAVPAGGASPHQYKWWIYDGAWKPVTGWTSSSTFAWTPTTTYPAGRVTVWARSAGNTADEAEASTAMDFVITGTATTSPPPVTPPPSTSPSARVSSVRIDANRLSPQPPGTTVTFNATPSGGSGPLQYKWWIYDGGWKVMGGWTTSSTFAWTPTTAYPYGRITVWVRSAANTVDEAEAAAAMDFVISGTPVTSQPAVVSSVALGANKIAPQPRGSSITWTATATGGVTPYQYKFLVWDGATKLVVRAWSTSNTFTWTPTMANQYYKVIVWVRSNGNIADAPEYVTEVAYPIH